MTNKCDGTEDAYKYEYKHCDGYTMVWMWLSSSKPFIDFNMEQSGGTIMIRHGTRILHPSSPQTN